MKLFFLVIETKMKIKLGSILEKFTHCQNRKKQASVDDCDNKICATTQVQTDPKESIISTAGAF